MVMCMSFSFVILPSNIELLYFTWINDSLAPEGDYLQNIYAYDDLSQTSSFVPMLWPWINWMFWMHPNIHMSLNKLKKMKG